MDQIDSLGKTTEEVIYHRFVYEELGIEPLAEEYMTNSLSISKALIETGGKRVFDALSGTCYPSVVIGVFAGFCWAGVPVSILYGPSDTPELTFFSGVIGLLASLLLGAIIANTSSHKQHIRQQIFALLVRKPNAKRLRELFRDVELGYPDPKFWWPPGPPEDSGYKTSRLK